MGLLDEAERLPREQLRALQEQELRALVERAWARVPFYRRRWEAAGVRPEQIRRLEDLRRLPVVTKQDFENDLKEHPPFGTYQGDFPAVRIQASSGTTGEPKPIFHTRSDWERIAGLWARRLWAQGVRPGDRVQIAFAYTLFIVGFSATEGAMRLGATVIPAGSGAVTPSRRQLELARAWGSTVLGATGSYALRLAEVAEEMGLDPARDFRFRVMFHTAEPLTEEARQAIQRRWGVRAYNNYGSVETGAPTYECQCQQGLHISEDAYIFEVVDPETDEVLPPGEQGAVVVTSLFKEAAPVIRYKIGDVAALWPEPCRCGRTFMRMGPVAGRIDEMVKVRGVTLYPTAVEAVLRTFPELGNEWRLLVDRQSGLERLTVQVETRLPGSRTDRTSSSLPDGAPGYRPETSGEGRSDSGAEVGDRTERQSNLALRVAERLRQHLGLRFEVELFSPGSLAPREDVDRRIKARRVVHLRAKTG